MRIFYAADHSPNSAIPGSRLWYANLYLSLRDLGHELVTFEHDLTGFSSNLDPSDPRQRSYIDAQRPRLEEALLAQVRRAHAQGGIDLFFSYFYSAHCRPDTIRAIRAMGIPTMNWYCNASYQFHLIRDLAPAYDWCLVPERNRLQDYRDIGANPLYVQEAANPSVYRPYDVPVRYDATFCGMRYGDRPELVSRLARGGVDVHVFGPGWGEADAARRGGLTGRLRSLLARDERGPVVGPVLADEDMVRLYSESRICLGFSSCGETHRTGERVLQVRLRDFEAPMSGAFYLVEYMEELTDFFEPDREMAFYRDASELVDKTRWYLARPAERERLRRAGHRRALAEHTWQHRFQSVFRRVGLGSRPDAG